MAGRALSCRFDGTTYLGIYRGNPGNPGTYGANEFSDLARISFACSQYAVGAVGPNIACICRNQDGIAE